MAKIPQKLVYYQRHGLSQSIGVNIGKSDGYFAVLRYFS
jgi:hypothetical protein